MHLNSPAVAVGMWQAPRSPVGLSDTNAEIWPGLESDILTGICDFVRILLYTATESDFICEAKRCLGDIR